MPKGFPLTLCLLACFSVALGTPAHAQDGKNNKAQQNIQESMMKDTMKEGMTQESIALVKEQFKRAENAPIILAQNIRQEGFVKECHKDGNTLVLIPGTIDIGNVTTKEGNTVTYKHTELLKMETIREDDGCFVMLPQVQVKTVTRIIGTEIQE